MGILSWLLGKEKEDYLDDGGEYRILSPLSSGGFGSTSLVQRKSTGDLFAAKRSLINEDYSESDLENELYDCLEVDHPNVAKAHKHYFERQDGGLSILCSFYQGPTLNYLLDNDIRLDLEVIAEIGYQVALGLQAIHRKRIIHGDLSPNNILLSEGKAVIIDFGLAKKIVSVITRTAIGTPGYVAPEAGFRRTSTRSDIFSLGCIIYSLFYGKSPVDEYWGRGLGLELQFRKKHTKQEKQLVNIIKKMISIDPLDRYKSASQVANALKTIAQKCTPFWWNELYKILYNAQNYQCASCNVPLPDFASYCPECGHGEYQTLKIFDEGDHSSCLMAVPCDECETPNASFWDYCYECGESLWAND